MCKNILIAVAILMLACGARAQEWGEMQMIYGFYWPDTELGEFNPSYSSQDSLLYFDDFIGRYDFSEGRLWYTKLNDDTSWDIPLLVPEPINLSSQPEIVNAMANISAGGDTLFFCSNRPGTFGGLDIWMSIKTDSTWSEPINLGDSINSELDELSPHYAPGINTLFFDRHEEGIGFHFNIYQSVYLGGNNWTSAERLPEIINHSGYGGYDASFDENTNTLYFNRSYDIYISAKTNGNWSVPERLSDNVNGLYVDNINGWVETMGASISADGNLLFYSKDVWEYSCIDFTSYLFYSDKLTGINETNNKADLLIEKIKAYPNPSNSKFMLAIQNSSAWHSVVIYDILGRVIKEYTNITAPFVVWDCTNRDNKPVSTGIYFAAIYINEEVITKKLILQK